MTGRWFWKGKVLVFVSDVSTSKDSEAPGFVAMYLLNLEICPWNGWNFEIIIRKLPWYHPFIRETFSIANLILLLIKPDTFFIENVMLLLINPYEENLSTGTRVGIPTRYTCTRGLVPGLYDAPEREIKMCRHDSLWRRWYVLSDRVPKYQGTLRLHASVFKSRVPRVPGYPGYPESS